MSETAPKTQTTITPHSQAPLVTRTYPTEEELDAAIRRAGEAQRAWARVPVEERVQVGRRFIVSLVFVFLLCLLLGGLGAGC